MPNRRPEPTPRIERVPARSLPAERLEWLSGFGMAQRSASYVFRPSTPEGIGEVFGLARRTARTVVLRGAGRSYGDASLNGEGLALDVTRMNRILDWDPDQGIIAVEPGVTIRQLWEYAIGDGWWPAVVPGTMHPTIAGAAAMNIHGKNNYAAGTFGEHIRDFEMILPRGDRLVCSRERNADLFHAAIGGFGVLGCLTRATLQLKRVHSGLLDVEAIATPSIREAIAALEHLAPGADYLVGWVDCFDNGAHPGRTLLHAAWHLPKGADPAPAQTLRVERQALPDTLFGILPKSALWRFMKPFVNDAGMRIVNAAKYASANLPVLAKKRYLQSHAAFAFLLDYVPDWRLAYLPGGFIQYQSFIPRDRAAAVFEEQVRLMHRRGLVSYLAVLKKHRADPFLLTHGLDGFSLALDFRVTRHNRAALWNLAHEFDRIVVDAGGRLYFAKDSTMRPETAERFLPAENLRRFFELRERCDPDGLLESELLRRVFPRGRRASRARAAAFPA